VHPRADAHLVVHSKEKDVTFPLAGKGVLRECGKVNRVTVPVEIQQGQLAHFTAPAGCSSLALFIDPFEPIIIEARLRAGSQSLGEFFLHGAAAADVHVVRDPGGAAVPGATVRIAAPSDTSPRATVPIEEAVTGADGWVHFPRLPILRDLRVIAQANTGEESVAADLPLEPHGHGVVDPLPIPKPADLTVEPKIDAAFLSRFPAAQVISVSIHPLGRSIDPSEEREQSLKDDTSVHFGSLLPGLWRANSTIKVAGTYSRIESEDIELKPGETRRYIANLKPLVFEGHAIAHGKWVPSRLAIVDPAGAGSPRLYFNSDADGVFHVVLPQPGIYSVEVAHLFVERGSQGPEFPVGEVDFSNPERLIEIEIPETRVVASVRNSERPVEHAVVTAALRRDGSDDVLSMSLGRVTDSGGVAIFEGLVPGIWTFAVRDKDSGRTAERALPIKEGDDASVVLDLEWTTAIKGTVHDLGGLPLPSAHIDCAYTGVAGVTVTAGADSDGEGKFTVDAGTPAPAAAYCSVIGPIGGVDAFVAVPDHPVDLTVPAAAATLRIPDWYQQQHPDMFWLAATDGRIISLSSVAAKTGRYGAPLVVRGLASGHWKVLRIQSMAQWAALGSGMGGSLNGIADFALDVDTTQTVNLYTSSAR
jgi:hypothetical protein